MKRDTVFRSHHSEISEFTFDESVASVFSDMINRSVPGYGTILSLLGVFARTYIQPNSAVYDLGTSLGGAAFAIASNLVHEGVTIHAIDSSSSMIDRMDELVKSHSLSNIIKPQLADIRSLDYKNASMVVLNLTLQFIPPADRPPLLSSIYRGLNCGGCCVLIEKIEDSSDDELFTKLYYDFKKANDYSELEISQKRTALENVLIPDSESAHIERLKSVGFNRVERWFQALNFRGYIAWK